MNGCHSATATAVSLLSIVESTLGGVWGNSIDEADDEMVQARVVRGTEFKHWNEEKGRGGAIRAINPSSLEKRRLKVGDILIEVSGGGPKQPVGRCLVVDDEALAGDLPLVFSNFVRRIRLKQQAIPHYVSIFLWYAHATGLTEQFQNNSTNLRNLDFKRFLAEVSVPLPSLAEQRRLVKRIEGLTMRAQELRSLNASLVEDADRLLEADYKRICRDARTQPFGKVAKLVRRRVEMHPDESYPETGIRSFGKGTFHKPALTGLQLGNKRVFRICTGDLVFMNVFAWEGAIAVAKPEDEGRVASHRFMMHEVDPKLATAEFLCYHLLTDHGLEHIRAASPGSAGRNRTLGITKLHAIPVPIPPIEAQRRFSKLHALRDKLRKLQAETESELAAFTPALLAKAFRGEL